MFEKVVLLLLLTVVVSAENYPGTVFFSDDGCKGSFGALQNIPNQCVQKPSGYYYRHTCDGKTTMTQTCKDKSCSNCEIMRQKVGCTRTENIVCAPLPTLTSKGVIGTISNEMGCKGIPTNYFMSYDDKCVGDWKLYCDHERGVIVYEKYRWNHCQGEVRKREFKENTCQMGIVLSVQMSFQCQKNLSK
eukprot:gene8240-65_t